MEQEDKLNPAAQFGLSMASLYTQITPNQDSNKAMAIESGANHPLVALTGLKESCYEPVIHFW